MLLVSLFLAPALLAQSPDSANQGAASPAPSSASAAEVPRLIKFSGTLLDAQDRPMAGPVGVTFALHAQQTDGAALWLETQNVTPDAHGLYTVLLGANSTNGVPAELFASGEARWLEVQVERQAEQPRVLLVSVPYALKAGDAQTLGGKPASAFLTTETLAGASNSAGASAAAPSSSSTALPSSKTQTTPKKAASAPQPAVACTSVTSDGTATVNSLALFTAACNIGSSLMTQALINGFPGVSLAGNNAGLLLSGTGTHQLTVTGLSSGRLGQDAQGFFFASDTPGKVIKFDTNNNGTLTEWMRITSAGNVGIGTTTPGAKLEIAGGNLALPNTTSGGAAGVVTLGNVPFLHNFGSFNTFVGTSAGNLSVTGGFGNNTGVGASVLTANTSGAFNSGFGAFALTANTTGFRNAAFGDSALGHNTTGGSNSAFGDSALEFNTTGVSNSAFGANALIANTTGVFNSAFGDSALKFNTTGASNSAFGASALIANTTGGSNAAFGDSALKDNTTGAKNDAFGASALTANSTGANNAAFGDSALKSNTMGAFNAAFGFQTLFANTTGASNSAFGDGALSGLTIGDFNIAIGNGAGVSLTSGSANIYIGNLGVGTESNTIRIGDPVAATSTFIAGIFGTIDAGGTSVFVNSSGQLGTFASSRRFKQEIVDMAGESDLLMKLRPVAFYYKPQYDDTHTRQYGLVAEEVAQVSPELVVFDKDGVPQTVRYHFVNAMLLNEVQKQRQLVEYQRKLNEAQQGTIARQQAEIQDLATRLAKLEALVSPAP
jgi:hypothetical protein